MPDHGTRRRYAKGCRCDDCTEANRVYCRTWRDAKPLCTFEGCTRSQHCRTWCKYHYEQWRRGEEQKPLRPFTSTETILDLLETDGGWLTAAGIALHLGINEDSVESRMRHLRQRGKVRSRFVPLSGQEGRTEWAA